MQKEKAIFLLETTALDMNSKQDFLNGLNLLALFDDDIVPEFDHDVCWASTFDNTVSKMTSDQVIQMAQWGWYYDDDNESWAHR